MFRDQLASDILRGASRLVVQVETIFFCGEVESRLRICGSETLEELLVRRRKAVVQFVSRGPKSVWNLH